MDEQKKDIFSFEPDNLAEAEPEENIPVEKKYNFDLFAENRGKNVDSGAQNTEQRSRQKETSALKKRRERSLDAEQSAPERTQRKKAPAEPASADRRKGAVLPTDIDESDIVNAVELDDDFQIGGFNTAKGDAHDNTAHVGTPDRRNAPPRRTQPTQRQTQPESGTRYAERSGQRNGANTDDGSVASYIRNHKKKVTASFIIAAIAIIAIAVLGSKIRIDVFGFTQSFVIVLLLILAVVLVTLGMFIRQKHRVIYSVLWVLVILIFAGSFAGVVLSGVCDFFGISRKRTISDFSIPEGGNWGTATIAQELYDEGIINHPTLFRVYSKLKHYDGTYQWGNYELNSEMDYGTIMYQLRLGNTASTVKVRIPEAATVDDIIKILEENNVCTRAQFIEAMDSGDYKYSWINSIPTNKVRYRFEGYLYPDTYNFYGGEPSVSNAEKAIDKMLNAFNSKLPDNWQEMVAKVGERIGKSDMTLNDAMAIGSILELEASGNPEEMKNVASVFYNRLTWSEPHYLGSTPTYYYPDNRYNTNAGSMTVKTEDGTEKTYPAGSEGIPPGPQCSLTEASILACLEPADTAYTYFVTDVDMNFYYNKSYTAHLNTIAKLKKSGKWA